jgi:subtilisin family serine protease
MDVASRRPPRWIRAASCPLFLALGLLATPSLTIADSTQSTDEPATSVPRQLIVGFDESSSLSERRQAVRAAGARIDEPIDSVDGALLVVRGNRSEDEVADRLDDSDVITYVEPNYVVSATRMPNDPAFARLWGLHNTGQLDGTPGADISAVSAWDVITDGDVKVAVVDTGIDYRHTDLDENVWTNPGETVDHVDNDGNGYVDDIHGIDLANGDSDPLDDSSHGTHVAGIIGAEGNNGVGTVGVSWKVKLMALKFLDNNGEGNTADAAAAIDYAVAAGAKVINASWGGPAFSQTLYQAVKRAGDQGVLFVAAAGNSTANADVSPDYPAAFDLPNVISVAASDPADELLYFSNYGKKSVDLAAPGEEIYSTVAVRGGVSGYGTYSGTSMAAPYVSGTAALYESRYPGSSVQTVRNAILSSVDLVPAFANKTVTGGRLDVARALGVGAGPAAQPASQPTTDVTPPSPFRLLRPRNRYTTRKRGLRFRWQASHDAGGIRYYKLYLDGKKRKTVRDPDGPGGRDPKTKTRLKLRGGRHRWTVRAYDYAGNYRVASSARKASTRRVLYIGKR